MRIPGLISRRAALLGLLGLLALGATLIGGDYVVLPRLPEGERGLDDSVFQLWRAEAEEVEDGNEPTLGSEHTNSLAAGRVGRQNTDGDALRYLGGTWIATHYGREYEDSTLGCPGAGVYHSADPSIIAVGPAHYSDVPCGTKLRVCRTGLGTDWLGSQHKRDQVHDVRCLVGIRQDSCPGCGPRHLDLSEAGMAILCGVETCDYLDGLTVEVLYGQD